MPTARFEHRPGERVRLSERARVHLASLTDGEIEAAALADPDAQPLTDEQLDRMVFRRELRLACQALAVDIDGLAGALRLPVETVRAWNRPGATPEPAARTLLRLVACDPQVILKLLPA